MKELLGLFIVLFLLMGWGAALKADHWVPENGEPVRLLTYCNTIGDVLAYALSGKPDPIPDDIECFHAATLFGGLSEGSVEHYKYDGKEWDVYRIGTLIYMNSFGFMDTLKGKVYISVERHQKDA
jgi:hypothetical protein